MSLTRIDETELLLPLHQAAAANELWPVFLTRLRRRLGGDYAGLLFGNLTGSAIGGREIFTRNANSMPLERGYQEHLYNADATVLRQLRSNRVYGFPDFPDPINREHDSFRDSILYSGGFEDHRLVRVSNASGAAVWLMVAGQARTISAADSSILSALAPHLQVALHTIGSLARIHERAAISEAAANRLGVGWFTLDANRMIDEAGGTAELLTSGRKLAETANTLSVSERTAATVGDCPRVEMLLDSSESGNTASGSIFWIRTQTTNRDGMLGALAGLYNLSHREALLAQNLCEGHSISESAARIGLTIETARNYTKRIYNKIGAKGQADLIRIILTSAAVMA